MSNRRKLAPHQTARRDQALAEASNRARNGQPVIVIDYLEPGTQCCWCDCDAFIHDCQHPCPEQAEHIVSASWSPRSWPVCDQHQTGPLQLLGQLERDVYGRQLQVAFGGGWMDEP